MSAAELVPPEFAGQWMFKVKEVAAICQICDRTVRRAIKKERLKALHVGGSIRITRDALETWLEERSGGAK
ncbi:MAG: Helix-turn-helix domain [Thermoleophilia bacterium]|nr:Helix-turn-helix domain [Thermoleophilia bacterium]